MKKHLIYWLAAFVIVIVGCQKELSFEGSNTPAEGSLQADVTGDCLPKTVNGTYVAASALVPATNTISVQVNVTKTGTYVITTDTVNGYYFRAASTFTTLGATTVTLRGNGTPFAPGVNNFVVSFDTTFCDIQVTVLPAGSGPAVFTLVSGGTPTNCASAVVAGTYVQNAVLDATNYVDIMVNVTTIGSYTIKATGGGMIFQATGTFSATGNQSVRLFATGSTPTTVGANTITFDPPFASCNFTVTVTAGAVYTIDCPNVVVNGTYQVGTPLGASNFITIPITVTTAGPYSISASINGMTFSGSGTLTLSSTSITLNGVTSTSPTNAGTFNLSVGSPACLIPITCTAAPTIDWKFNIGATVYQGTSSTVPGDIALDNTTFPPVTFLFYIGFTATNDEFDLDLADLTGGITAGEQYNTNSTGATNAADFYFTLIAGTLDLVADNGQVSPPANITYVITSHDTVNRKIIGTFSGTAYDTISGTVKNITAGTFTITYP